MDLITPEPRRPQPAPKRESPRHESPAQREPPPRFEFTLNEHDFSNSPQRPAIRSWYTYPLTLTADLALILALFWIQLAAVLLITNANLIWILSSGLGDVGLIWSLVYLAAYTLAAYALMCASVLGFTFGEWLCGAPIYPRLNC